MSQRNETQKNIVKRRRIGIVQNNVDRKNQRYYIFNIFKFI